MFFLKKNLGKKSLKIKKKVFIWHVIYNLLNKSVNISSLKMFQKIFVIFVIFKPHETSWCDHIMKQVNCFTKRQWVLWHDCKRPFVVEFSGLVVAYANWLNHWLQSQWFKYVLKDFKVVTNHSTISIMSKVGYANASAV